MAKELILRRGTTTQHSTFTGKNGEVTVDTDKKTVVVHDNITAGGTPLAKESTLTAHTSDTSNPHNVTKTQIGLGSVDNTADSTKNVLSATKLATARTITLTGDVSGSTSFDGSGDVTLSAQVHDNSHNHTSLSGTVTFDGSTGNDFNNSNIIVKGNGTANTIKPSISFHQPYSYAGTLAMLNGNIFQFSTQSGQPATLNNHITGNAEYATTAGRAYPRGSNGADLNFYWSGQDGQPTWLWGGTDGVNMYVYNPSNFSVNYATSARYAETAPVGTNTTQIATTAFVLANSAAVTSTTVGTTIAEIAAGAVGSYVFALYSNSTYLSYGSTTAGSNLSPASIAITTTTFFSTSGTTVPGTWRCMGHTSNSSRASLFLRIA